MNTALSKALIYVFIVILGIVLLIYFYNILTTESMEEEFTEISTRIVKTKLEGDIDLELFESSKFINLKKTDKGQAVFRAGRRNPFEPYE